MNNHCDATLIQVTVIPKLKSKAKAFSRVEWADYRKVLTTDEAYSIIKEQEDQSYESP